MTEFKGKTTVVIPRERISCIRKLYSFTEAQCTAFFPADVILTEKSAHLCFTTEGFRPAGACSYLCAEDAFAAVKGILIQIESAKDWLWFPEEYILSLNTVWINGSGQVKFLCIPDDSRVSCRTRLQSLLFEMGRLSDPAVFSSLQAFGEMLKSEMVRPEKMLSELDQMAAEVLSYF